VLPSIKSNCRIDPEMWPRFLSRSDSIVKIKRSLFHMVLRTETFRSDIKCYLVPSIIYNEGVSMNF
jgi:hypothetical protein